MMNFLSFPGAVICPYTPLLFSVEMTAMLIPRNVLAGASYVAWMLFLNQQMAAENPQLSSLAKRLKTQNSIRIGYVYSPELVEQCDRVPNLQGRVRHSRFLSACHLFIQSLFLWSGISHTKLG